MSKITELTCPGCGINIVDDTLYPYCKDDYQTVTSFCTNCMQGFSVTCRIQPSWSTALLPDKCCAYCNHWRGDITDNSFGAHCPVMNGYYLGHQGTRCEKFEVKIC